MTTTTGNITQGTSVIAMQQVAANAEVVSAEIAVSGKLAAQILIHFARLSGNIPVDTNGNPAGVNFRIEGAFASSGAGKWAPLAQYRTGVAAAATATNTSSSGATQNVSGAVGSFNPQDIVFLQDGTFANSEWARIKQVLSGTAILMEENIITAHATGSIYNMAEIISVPIDLSGIGRFRVVADGSNHNQTWACEVIMNTLDSLATV